MNNKDNSPYDPEDFERLVHAVSSWYVRRDGKYYDVDRPAVKLSKDDVIRASLVRFGQEFPDAEFTPELTRDVFRTVIDRKHAAHGASIPVWDGRIFCAPSSADRQLPHRGTVAVNSWIAPEYRSYEAEPDLGAVGTFIEKILPDPRQREKILD